MAAQQRLREAVVGPRLEELEAARAVLKQAEAERDQAHRDLARQQQLFEGGAVPCSLWEEAQTRFEVTRQTAENAEARLEELERGTRPEQIAQARAQVGAAQARLAGAAKSRQARLQELRDQPRPEDVELAAARLEETRRAAQVARERLQQAELRAPYDGRITELLRRAGDVAGPNQPVLSLARVPQLEVRCDVDESRLDRLKPGLEAVVNSDAFKGETFSAVVYELGGRVDSERGTIEVRLNPVDPPGWLLPGQTLNVNLVLERAQEKLVVPLTSVSSLGKRNRVMVLERGRVGEREVVVGPPGIDTFPVESGLTEDDLVLVYPTRVTPGQRARAAFRS